METTFDVNKIREDFPLLNRKVYGKPLVYFDNAATTQKPIDVINAIDDYYRYTNSNVHRGVHFLSNEATDQYEAAREKIRAFINAEKTSEIIYVRGTTEAINLVAYSYGRKYFSAGDEIIISALEHHANIVPWQIICEATGAVLKVIPVTDEGELIYEEYEKLLSEKTKFVSVAQISNVLGTINPIKKIIDDAHKFGAKVLIDGAQAVQHQKVDVRALDCDFYVFSSHKIYGPTGTGVLYGKEKILDEMPPYQTGGDMIKSVSFEKTTFNDLPYKFEAGTPDIAGSIGLGFALDYINKIGLDKIGEYENQLLRYGTDLLLSIDGVRIIGTAKNKASVISFVCGSNHPYDTGTILDNMGIAVRTGYHCAEPLIKRYNLPGTVRASFAFYNTTEEIDRLKIGIIKSIKMLNG